jgi:putative flippase GtrA
MEKLIKKHADKLRFAVVGGANTAIDFSILFILVLLGIDKITSNFISTSIALLFSFFANKKFAFKNVGKSSHYDVIKFLGITLFGLWAIQPLIINSIVGLTDPLHINKYIVLFVAKCLATGVTMVWNYLLYRKFVFNKQI